MHRVGVVHYEGRIWKYRPDSETQSIPLAVGTGGWLAESQVSATVLWAAGFLGGVLVRVGLRGPEQWTERCWSKERSTALQPDQEPANLNAES